MTWVIILILVVLFILFIRAGLTKGKTLKSTLTEERKKLAELTGATFHAGTATSLPKVEGTYKNSRFSVAEGDTGQLSQKITVFFDNPKGLALHLHPEGALEKMEKSVGMQDIQLGVPEFDSKFLIKGNHPDDIKKMLSPDLCKQILELQRFNLHISHDKAVMEESLTSHADSLLKSERMVKVLETVIVLLSQVK